MKDERTPGRKKKPGITASFVYNAEGLRVRKTVNSVVTNYTLHGKNIVHMTQGSNTLHFWYDDQNRPAIVQFNGTKYAYIHNLQGDIVGLIDSSGTEVVKYIYDPWGKILSTTGSLASTVGTVQPFRYRGYVYDVETELYYLRSRYYNSIWNRFINGDLSIAGNLFCYCGNSIVAFADSEGEMPVLLLNALSGLYNSGLLLPEDVTVLTFLFNGGNIYNAFHEVAQLNTAKYIFETTGISSTLEYKLPNGKEADVMAANMLWEIKPVTQTGLTQLNGYLDVSGLKPGSAVMKEGIPIISNIYMGLRPKENEPGVVEYYFLSKSKNKRKSGVF